MWRSGKFKTAKNALTACQIEFVGLVVLSSLINDYELIAKFAGFRKRFTVVAGRDDHLAKGVYFLMSFESGHGEERTATSTSVVVDPKMTLQKII
jgi:hypothetical protein